MAEARKPWKLMRLLRDKLAMRKAVLRAKELMEKKCLGAEEKKERDSLIKLLGERGNSREHNFLKEWVVRGELCCRPAPQVLAGAIANGGYDELHLKRISHTIAMCALADLVGNKWVYGRDVPPEEQYYLTVFLAAESGLLLQDIRNGHNTLLALLEGSAAKLAANFEARMPGMVELLRKEMDG